MTVIVKSQCIDCEWNRTSGAYLECPGGLSVLITFLSSGAGVGAISFAGRPAVGLNCLASETYVTYSACTPSGSSCALFSVDVWGAYRAGIWSSSTTIVGYAQSPVITPETYCFAYGSLACTTHAITPSAVTGACPTVSKFTITITDTGVVTGVP